MWSSPSPEPIPERGGTDTDPVARGDAHVLNRPGPKGRAGGQPALEEPILYCVLGPQVLQRIDEMEQEGQGVTFDFNGTPATAEETAGRLIAGCEEQLQEVTSAAQANTAELRASTKIWMVNLVYMQSWLRERMGNAPADPE